MHTIDPLSTVHMVILLVSATAFAALRVATVLSEDKYGSYPPGFAYLGICSFIIMIGSIIAVFV